MNHGLITHCRTCSSPLPAPFFDLGEQPLANSLLNAPDEKEVYYPLALARCDECGLVQLTFTVPPEILFTQYVWVTGTSSTARGYADEFCERLLARGSSPQYVLELASNDGTFLKPFIAKGREVLGVDPAQNIAQMANADGIPTLPEFWTADFARRLQVEQGSAGFIFARNVIPHVADARDFIEGVAAALADDGVFAAEIHDARIIQKELHYDSIYHEHLCYFTFAPFERLLNEFGLRVFDIEKSPISGGSMVIYASKLPRVESPALAARRVSEQEEKTNTQELWDAFAKRSQVHKEEFIALLRESKNRGETLAGYGASARSSTLLNFCGIDASLLSVIADGNPLKQGKYTAGTHIPIRSSKDVMAERPDAVVILAWNFFEELKSILKTSFDFSGSLLVPLSGSPRIEKIR